MAKPTREQIANEYALALGVIDRLRRERDELLAALRLCRAIIGSESKGARIRAQPEAIALADAAIAKAEGR